MCMERNIHSYIYAPSCGFIQSSEWAGYSCPTDQDLWAKTVKLYAWCVHMSLYENFMIFSQYKLCLHNMSLCGSFMVFSLGDMLYQLVTEV